MDVSSSQITVKFGSFIEIYTGLFSYDGATNYKDIHGTTIFKRFFHNDELLYSIYNASGYNIDTIFNYAAAGNAADLSKYLAGGGDTILLSGENDIFVVTTNNNIISGSGGNDIIEARVTTGNIVKYNGSFSDYTISYVLDNGTRAYLVKDNRLNSPDGFDEIAGFKLITFSDGLYPILSSSGYTLREQYFYALRAEPVNYSASAFYSDNVLLEDGLLTAANKMKHIISAASQTTSVATIAYQFFTGSTPSSAGLDYLVSPTGANANNLNSAYYQNFGLENRYINFAVNLGKDGAGKAAFAAGYGSLSLFDATRKAYTTLFGSTPSDTKLHALLDPTFAVNGTTMTRSDYFAYYGGDGPNGIGTKAAMVGWLMSEAVKADVGVYATANDLYLTDLANGKSVYAVDLVGVYHGTPFISG